MTKEELIKTIQASTVDKSAKDLVITAVNIAYNIGKTEGYRVGVDVGTKTAQIANLLLKK